MMMDNIEHAFFGFSMIVFGFLGVSWGKNNISNLVIKFVFLGMSAWASWLLANALGYIVKV
jgi:hypothetical protein